MMMDKDAQNRPDDTPVARPHATPFAEIVTGRFSRRSMLKGSAATGLALFAPSLAEAKPAQPLSVTGLDPNLRVAAGHTFNVVARWGDPVVMGAAAFDPENQSAAAQAMQFGDAADFVAIRPLTPKGHKALLCVNHEFANPQLMFPGFGAESKMNGTQTAITQNAMGFSIVEIAQEAESRKWQRTAPGRYNRRITAASTPCAIEGPAAGHKRLDTDSNAGGRTAPGTLGNCAGGVTPWGTVLTAEENIQFFFSGDPDQTAEAEAFNRYTISGKPIWNWGDHDPRFHLNESPNTPNLYGWLVEIDPYNPSRAPIKRTALGRFKHEGAGCITNKDGRVVVYMGDDQKFEYIYRYVSKGRVNSKAHAAINGNLLNDGTLSVAEFTENEIIWHPLVHGQGPLTAANGFHSQADVVIEARRAADLLGATPMDRPEDIEVNPKTGLVYAMLTNNTDRGYFDGDAANPRGPNLGGHVIEMIPPADGDGARDHAAARFTWDIFLQGGPREGLLMRLMGQHGVYHPDTPADQWLGAPDNCTFTQDGRMVIATDGMEHADMPDGLFIMDTQGSARALPKRLLAAPIGSEVCGPAFAPDERALFCAIQHPGMGSMYGAPSTRFPDFDPTLPPRSAVVAVRRLDGGLIT